MTNGCSPRRRPAGVVFASCAGVILVVSARGPAEVGDPAAPPYPPSPAIAGVE